MSISENIYNILSLEILMPLLKAISVEHHFRTAEEVFDFLLEAGYQLLPFPIRMVVSETIYKQFCLDRKSDITDYIWINCDNCGVKKNRFTECDLCATQNETETEGIDTRQNETETEGIDTRQNCNSAKKNRSEVNKEDFMEIAWSKFNDWQNTQSEQQNDSEYEKTFAVMMVNMGLELLQKSVSTSNKKPS